MPSRRPQCILSSRPGALLGVVVGLFFGEHRLSSDHWEAFILLLQMTVLPYIVLSLITGLGNLTYEQVKTLALRVGTLLLISWGLAFRHPADAPGVSNLDIGVLLQYLPDREAGRDQSPHPVHSGQPFLLDVQQFCPGGGRLQCGGRDSAHWHREQATPPGNSGRPQGPWDGSPSLWPN